MRPYNYRKRKPSRPGPGKSAGSDSLQILFEDDQLIAVCKPDGILTQGDATGDASQFRAVKEYLSQQTGQSVKDVYLGLVHRLDRPVWGVVIFAKNPRSAAHLSEQFREGTIEKTYRAVVEGLPDQLEGRLSGYLLRREGTSSRVYDKPVTDGQEVSLEYRVIAANEERSVLEIHPQTGRKHQIRAQLAHLGHPIAGDFRYGSRTKLPGERLALMAASIRFSHPINGKTMVIEAPEPGWWPVVS